MPPWNNQDVPFAKTVIVVTDKKKAFSSANNAISELHSSQCIGLTSAIPINIKPGGGEVIFV